MSRSNGAAKLVGPSLSIGQRITAHYLLRNTGVPDGVKVSFFTAEGYFNPVPAFIEILVVERLMNVTYELCLSD